MNLLKSLLKVEFVSAEIHLGSISPDEESFSSQMRTHAAKVSYIWMHQSSIVYVLEHATTLHHRTTVVFIDSKSVV